MPVEVHVRDATASDISFIQEMLYEAANRPGDNWPPLDESIRKSGNFRFWRDWPRPGDIGVIAEADRAPVGAAWIRHFEGEDLAPWDESGVPVLAIGVVDRFRDKGIGRGLLDALIARASSEQVRAIDLATGTFNERAVHLYHALGFRDTNRSGHAIGMRLTLA